MPKTILDKSVKPRLYCGNKHELPSDYDDFGSPYDCLKKGFGAGKASCSNSSKKVLKLHELVSIAKELGIPLKTARGTKKPATLIKNIINVLEDLQPKL
tara:strand:+ start:110 stop:406 length:297 start_codon:yes stop_codon:yes gene_type:complete